MTAKDEKMKLLYQFGVIITISFLGEVLHAVLPLPIPASIYGLVLMLLVLCTGLVKLEKVKEAGNFLLDVMPPMFIPAGVGLLTAWEELRPILIPMIVIILLTTVIVMAVTGRISQSVIRREKKRHE